MHLHRYRLLASLLLCKLFTFSALAQQPPYDKAPEARPPYYRVRYEASEQPGELIFPVSYTVWIPPAVDRIRGLVVHQHGCGEGSCRSGQTGAFDLHWQALASRHGCALLAPVYEQPDGSNCQMWCDPRNGSADVFKQALHDLGRMSGHAELASAPWAMWGHSGGGHWVGGISLLYPERTIAAWLRSGVPLVQPEEDQSIRPYQIDEHVLQVPLMCNLGTREGVTQTTGRFAAVWGKNQEFFKTLRRRGGLVGIAIDPLSSHDCGNQRYLAIPWLDACMSARLPAEAGEPLRQMPQAETVIIPWTAGTDRFSQPTPPTQAKNAEGLSIWLPDQKIATAWQHYTRDTKVPDTTPPPHPRGVQMIQGHLTWQTEADLESGIAHFEIHHLDRQIAVWPAESTNRFGRPVFQGLQYSDTPSMPLVPMRFRVPAELQSARAEEFRVIAVNTVGLRSTDEVSQ